MLALLLSLVVSQQADPDESLFGPLQPLGERPEVGQLLGSDDAQLPRDRERTSRFQPWKKNYFLVAWNPDLSALPSPATGGENLDVETNFQLSIRANVFDDFLLEGWGAHIGYTGTSFWQMFDSEDSSPFRTTDHTPELFAETRDFAGQWRFRFAPAQHQSNGESGAASRSWNRTYAEGIWFSDVEKMRIRSFERADLDAIRGVRVALRVWEDWGVDDSNNPDIADYYGHFELNAGWYTGTLGDSALALMLRNNLRSGSDNRSTVRLEWSFSVTDDIRLLLQYYTGYGLNLLDYDRHQQSVGFGLEISP